VEGAQEAFAVDGSPADSVMLALNSEMLQNPSFDLVVSGINRGDNCGLHVIYSGTVGAAREAACKDVAALAFSLDSWTARSEEQYAAAATYAVAIIRATLGLLPGIAPSLPALRGVVINVNVPGGELAAIRGLHLCWQGQHCSFPEYRDVDVDPHFGRDNGHQHAELKAGAVTVRAFRNAAGRLRGDERQGTDSWAVAQGFVAVTPLGLVSDIPLTPAAAAGRAREEAVQAVSQVMRAAASALGVQAAGTPPLG
jgi:5'-nucleotidase